MNSVSPTRFFSKSPSRMTRAFVQHLMALLAKIVGFRPESTGFLSRDVRLLSDMDGFFNSLWSASVWNLLASHAVMSSLSTDMDGFVNILWSASRRSRRTEAYYQFPLAVILLWTPILLNGEKPQDLLNERISTVTLVTGIGGVRQG
ncbi:unnamed protein product [Arabidopsis thaliana]|uniref:Uncharacterized protein n=1 Tax=Arabidopsis thaliana TaxID=3702 RepID=A0A654EZ40_ARATH|nr:unnamed protein product [Arabidopsis thaliana]